MRDKVHLLCTGMKLLGAFCFLCGCITGVLAIESPLRIVLGPLSIGGIVTSTIYFYAAYCLARFRRRAFVHVVIAGSFPLACTGILMMLALPVAIGGMVFMAEFDVCWTFAQVRQGKPLAEVLATTPPPGTFGDERDDYDDKINQSQ